MRGRIIWLAAAVAADAWATNTYGQTAVTWDGTTGAYTTATNWNPDVVPSNAADQFLTINNGGTAQVITGDTAEGAQLYLGLRPTETGHLTINGGTMNLGELRVGGFEAIPDLVTPGNPPTLNGGGTGTVIQNGGTVNINFADSDGEPPRQSLWVGDAGLATGNTANGGYTITGTESAPAVLLNGIANNDGIFIGTGVGTVGTFTQNAFTTVTTTGFLNVGRRGANGTYNLNGGALNANAGGTSNALTIGDGDAAGIQPTTGTFNQTNGTFIATGGALIGRRNGEGFYNISGGSLTVSAEMRVGDQGSTAAGIVNAKGTLTVSGTGSVTVGANLNIGIGSDTVANNVVGTLTQTGGSIVLSGTGATIATVGNGLGSSGTANLSGGTFSQTAGSATANFDIGRNSSSGIVNISGTHIFNGRQVTINSTNVAATRQLNISGGTFDVDTLTFGTLASQATRLLDISGGTVNIGALTTGQAAAGGQALTHIRGGNVMLENTVTFFTGSVFRLSTINLVVPANSTYGNATIDVLGSSVLTLNGSFGTGADDRTLTKTGPGTLTVNGEQSYLLNAAVTINDGTVNFNTDAGAGGANLAVNAHGGIANFGATQSLRLIDVAGDGLVNVSTSNVNTAALILDASPQTLGLTYGSLASSAVIKSNEYFAGTGIVTVGLAGDYNSNGEVDAADYVIWRENPAGFGDSAGYSLWRQNFGNVSAPGASAGLAGNQAVPEPSTLLVATAGVLLVCAGRRSRK